MISAIRVGYGLLSPTLKDSVGKWEKKQKPKVSELHEVNVQFWETEFISRQLFCDFGEEFQVLDQDGEAPVSAAVQNVTKVGLGCF